MMNESLSSGMALIVALALTTAVAWAAPPVAPGLALGESSAAEASPSPAPLAMPPPPPASMPPAPLPPPSSMSVVPAEEPPSAPAVSSSKPKKIAARRPGKISHFEVEPAKAHLKIKTDTWLYNGPSNRAKRIKRAHAGKYVDVTGSTRYYLQVALKSGQTGYIAQSAVELVSPTDKVFLLTADAAVLKEPNRWAKKLSEVHKGHDVHVTGVSLNYMQIQMKSGLTGFIPSTALE